MEHKKKRIRVGVDVGGTFTKAVAIDVKTGSILSKSTVPTTHNAEKVVSEGILHALSNILNESDINIDDIELISHSTTQAIKVDQGNQEFHEKEAGTFVKTESGSVNPYAHD